MTHTEEVKELFEKLTIEISPDSTKNNIKAISLDAFTLAIDTMMNKARWYGQKEAIYEASSIIDNMFTDQSK